MEKKKPKGKRNGRTVRAVVDGVSSRGENVSGIRFREALKSASKVIETKETSACLRIFRIPLLFSRWYPFPLANRS